MREPRVLVCFTRICALAMGVLFLDSARAACVGRIYSLEMTGGATSVVRRESCDDGTGTFGYEGFSSGSSHNVAGYAFINFATHAPPIRYFPPAVGQAWSDIGTSNQYPVTASVAVVSITETVTVPAGTFAGCAKTVETEAYLPEDDSPYRPVRFERWYAPGVGLVKIVGEYERGLPTRQTAELVSYQTPAAAAGDYLPLKQDYSWTYRDADGDEVTWSVQQEVRLHAEFEIIDTHHLAAGVSAFTGGPVATSPYWNLEYENLNTTAFAGAGITFSSPVDFTQAQPVPSLLAGMTVAWTGVTLPADEETELGAEQATTLNPLNLPVFVQRSWSPRRLTASGNVTVTVEVRPLAGFDWNEEMSVEVTLLGVDYDGVARESMELLGHTQYLSFSNPSQTRPASGWTVDEGPSAVEGGKAAFVTWAWNEYTPLQVDTTYTFTFTCRADLLPGVAAVNLEPRVCVAGGSSARTRHWDWTGATAQVGTRGSVTVLPTPTPGYAGTTGYEEIRFHASTLAGQAQVISFPPIPDLYVGAADYDPQAGATSGLPVTYSSDNNAVATIVNNKVRPVGVGACVITASQGGGENGGLTWAPTAASRPITITTPDIFVDASAQGNGDGKSWGNARHDLHAVILGARSGTTIHVAAGVYKPFFNVNASGGWYTGNPRDVAFQLKNGVTLLGGYPQGGGARDPGQNPTILSGDIGIEGEAADDCYDVFHHPSSLALDSSAVLDGFTVAAGGGPYNKTNMHNTSASPTLRHCSFLGGRVSNISSSPAFTNCTFLGSSGGAVYNSGPSSPTFTNCAFSGNGNSGIDGGAVYSQDYSRPTFTNCTFSGNIARGGAVYSQDYSRPTFTNCTFSGNIASYGGALYTVHDADASFSTLDNCIVWGNIPQNDQIRDYYGVTTVTHSCVQGGYAGIGNISGDPMFVDAAGSDGICGTPDDDLRLHAGSPCIDAGSNSVPNLPATDLAGNARRIDDPFTTPDTGTGSAPVADMGAHEYVPPPGPRVLVTVDGLLVRDGQIVAIDFGRTAQGQSGLSRTFVVRNAGGQTLTLGVPSLPPGYTLTESLVSEIAPGASASFAVRLGSETFGVKAGRISLVTNDPAATPFDFPITGTVTTNGSIYVDDTATGSGAGDSWTDALTDLQLALDLASAGATIHVAAGTYKPSTEVAGSGPRYRAFQLKNGVTILGGYRDGGGEREPSVYTTIFSGDIGTVGDASDNCYHVFHHPQGTNLDPSAVLDGVTITGGNANGSTTHAGGGGGVHNDSCSPTLRNCVIAGNSAEYGGGMDSRESSSPLINCAFVGNDATKSGGAIYIWTEVSSPPTFTNCTFAGNRAGTSGGGVYSATYYSLRTTLANCIVWGNTAPSDAQISGAPVVTYSCIQGGYTGTGNTAADPLFVDADGPDGVQGTADDDLRQQPGSPCIDAGNNAAPNLPDTDLDGYDRRLDIASSPDTGAGAAPVVDMGAYESVPAAPEIRVTTNGVAVTSGQASVIDFGKVQMGQPGPPRTFTVCNGGGATLRLGSLVLPAGYSLVEPLVAELQPRTQDSFTVRFDGDRLLPPGDGQVSFTTNDSDENPFRFPVRGTVTTNGALYVDDTATGGNDGSSWPDSLTDLQLALNVAVAGATIHVAEGTYRPSVEVGGSGSRFRTFQLKNGLTILGGYPDGGGARDPDANPTILSGDIGTVGVSSDNCYHVFYHPSGTNLDATAVLDGVTITGGNDDNGGYPRGGGMYNDSSSPRLSRCVFAGNTAYMGGAMYNANSSPTVVACTFAGNRAQASVGSSYGYGGGMYNDLSSAPVLTGCTFAANSAGSNGEGGGMHNRSASPTLTNCTFAGNTAKYGAGVYNVLSSSPTITNCTFAGNSASWGGAVYSWGGSGASMSRSALANCLVWGNTPLSDPVKDISYAVTTVTYSCVQGGYVGVGNISADPLFIDADGPDNVYGTADDDLRLHAGSPGIDAGNNSVPNLPETDHDGNPRRRDSAAVPDTGSGTAPLVDVGAYEFAPVPGLVLLVTRDGAMVPASGGPVVDFGTVVEEQPGPERTFTVRNVSDDGSVLVLGALAASAGFTVTDGLAPELAAGESDSFTVRLDSVTPGTKAGQIVFTSNVVGNSPCSIPVAGTVLRDPLELLAEALDCPRWPLTTSGSQVWSQQTGTTHDGVDAAASGAITHDQETVLQTAATGPGTVSFWWKVSSEASHDYLRLYVDGTASYAISGSVDWQQKSYTLTAGEHTLRWVYRKDASGSAGSDRGWVDQLVLPANVPVISTTSPLPTGLVGRTYSQDLAATGGLTPYVWSLVSGSLPQGLALSAAGVISGTPTAATTTTATVTVQVTGSDGQASAPKTFSLTVTTPNPVSLVEQRTITTATAALHINLPDLLSVVRVQTSLGSAEIQLFPGKTPVTVQNFLTYVTDNDYDATLVHRSVPGFVVNGGGYRVANSQFTAIPTDPPIANEPGISNVRGTFAMAKLSGDPNSATSQWFVNLGDNAANLDVQNGGFTVFGQVIGTGMAIFDAIAALPRYNLGSPLTEVPLRGVVGGSLVPADNLVWVDDISVLSDLIYWTTVGDPDLATADIIDNELILTPARTKLGYTAVILHATTAAGAYAEAIIELTVNAALPTIATASPLPSGRVGTAYTQTLAATGSTMPYTWSITSGSLPPGLNISSDGVISGTPTTALTATFTVQVTGTDNQSTSQLFSLTIDPHPLPVLTASSPAGDQDIREGQLVHFSATFSDAVNSPQDDGIASITWERRVDGGTFSQMKQDNFTPVMAGPQTSTYQLSTDFFTSRTGHDTVYTVRATGHDGLGVPATREWQVTVRDVNQAPTMVLSASSITVSEDCGAQVAAAWATGISAGANEDVTGQVLTAVCTTDNDSLFTTSPALDLASGDLSFTPAANANGVAHVTLTLRDNGGTENGGADTTTRTFSITITPVNDAPSFVPGPSQSVVRDSGLRTVTGWASDICPGPDNEAGQAAQFQVSCDAPSLFMAQPRVEVDGTLRYRPVVSGEGIAVVTVILADDGGRENGGEDRSAPQTFTIAVNLPPWYPPIVWEPLPMPGVRADYTWYNVEIWAVLPGTAGAEPVFSTNVNGLSLGPNAYLAAGFGGLAPGTYYWRVRGWAPDTSTYGSWQTTGSGPGAGVYLGTIDIEYPEASVVSDARGLTVTPAIAPTPEDGVRVLGFTIANARSYELNVTGVDNGYAGTFPVTLVGDAGGAPPLNQAVTHRVDGLPPGSYTWRVRALNPLNPTGAEAGWVVGPSFAVRTARLLFSERVLSFAVLSTAGPRDEEVLIRNPEAGPLTLGDLSIRGESWPLPGLTAEFVLPDGFDPVFAAGAEKAVILRLQTTGTEVGLRASVQGVVSTAAGDTDPADMTTLRITVVPDPVPDLVVRTEWLECEPAPGVPNEPTTIRVTVANGGTGPAEDAVLRLLNFGEELDRSEPFDLAAGASRTFEFHPTFLFPDPLQPGGVQLITVEVDADDAIAEIDEFNNTASKAYQVGDGSGFGSVLGGIVLSGGVSPELLVGSWSGIACAAVYELWVQGRPNYDFPVRGANVAVAITNELGVQVFSAADHTDTWGGLNIPFPVPGEVGDVFQLTVEVTDQTFTGTLIMEFTVVAPTVEFDAWLHAEDIGIQAEAGGSLSIAVRVHAGCRNNVTLHDVPVEFYAITSTTGPVLIGTSMVPEIVAGGAATTRLDWHPPQPGDYVIEVRLGPNWPDDEPRNDVATQALVVGNGDPRDGMDIDLSSEVPTVLGAGQRFSASCRAEYGLWYDVQWFTTAHLVWSPHAPERIRGYPVKGASLQATITDKRTGAVWAIPCTGPLRNDPYTGQSGEFSFGFETPGPGYYRLTVEADDHTWVGRHTADFEVPGAKDVAIYSEDIAFEPALPASGESIAVAAAIHAGWNNRDTLTDVPVQFSMATTAVGIVAAIPVNSGLWAYPIGADTIPSLGPGATATTTPLHWEPPKPSVYVVEAGLGPDWSDDVAGNDVATRAVIAGIGASPDHIRVDLTAPFVARTRGGKRLGCAFAATYQLQDAFGRWASHPVKGGGYSVKVERQSTGETVKEWSVGHTNGNGQATTQIKAPRAAGDYWLVIAVSDQTLAGETRVPFTVYAVSSEPVSTPGTGGTTGAVAVDVPQHRDAFVRAEDLAFSKANPHPGETIQVGAVIHADERNTETLFDVPVRLYISYPELEPSAAGGTIPIGAVTTIPVLRPGATYPIWATWTPHRAGIFILQAAIGGLIDTDPGAPGWQDRDADNDVAARALMSGIVMDALTVEITEPLEALPPTVLNASATTRIWVRVRQPLKDAAGYVYEELGLGPADVDLVGLRFNGAVIDTRMIQSNYAEHGGVGQFFFDFTPPCDRYGDVFIDAFAQRCEPTAQRLLEGMDSLTVMAHDDVPPVVLADARPDPAEIGTIVRITVSTNETLVAGRPAEVRIVDSSGAPITIDPRTPIGLGPNAWRYDTLPLPEGTAPGLATVTIVAEDLAHGVTQAVETFFIRGPDTEAPEIVERVPAAGMTGVPLDADLVLIFNEEVFLGTTGQVEIRDAADDSLFDAFAMVPGEPRVSVFGNRVEVNPSPAFLAGHTYYALMNGACLRDSSGNFFPGYTTATDWTFTANRAPANVSLSENTIAENRLPGTVVGTFSTQDSDHATEVDGTFVYALVSGDGSAGNDAFAIVQRALVTRRIFDRETDAAFQIRVRVSDGGGMAIEREFTVSVTGANDSPPILASIGSQHVDEDVELSLAVTATDADLPGDVLTFSLDTDSLARGATIDAVTGVFRWTPTEAQGPGDFPVTITVTDSGTPALNASGTFMVRVNEVAGAWEFVIHASQADKAIVSFGMSADATDGWDDGIDWDSPQAPAPVNPKGGIYFVDSEQFLYSRDIRAMNDTALWFLEVVTNASPMTLSWDSAQIPEGMFLRVVELDQDGVVKPHTRCDMRAIPSLAVPAETIRWFQISYSPFVLFELSLGTGWNLVSLPIEPRDPDVEVVFAAEPQGAGEDMDDGHGGTVTSGEIWQWMPGVNGHYQTVTAVHACVGLWVYVPSPATIAVEGTPVKSALSLMAGWNLVGTGRSIPLPDEPRLRGRCWWWDTQAGRNQALDQGETMAVGRGYWLFATEPFVLDLDR